MKSRVHSRHGYLPIKYTPSKVFELLNSEIIEDLIYQILQESKETALDFGRNTNHPCILIGKRFDELRNQSVQFVTSSRLDRHKLAACICSAIIEVKPLISAKDNKMPDNSNELLAFYTALNVIKMYMIYDKLNGNKDQGLLLYLKENFDMETPTIEENICDVNEYILNIANAIGRTQIHCKRAKSNCNKFDIWAYANIFFHLEIYNQKKLDICCFKYKIISKVHAAEHSS